MSNTIYSTNDEDFLFHDVGSVLDALKREGRLRAGTIYYAIDSEPCHIREFLQVGRILESAGEQAYDELGECSEGCFDLPKDAEEELQAALYAWADKHLSDQQHWRCVGKSRELLVTDEDVAALAQAVQS